MADYLYNALGQQVHRTVHFGGGTAAITLSVHDLNGNRLSEHDAGGVVLREYIWLDGRPLAVIEGGQMYWLHWDQIGRPVMATDGTGAVVWAASYLPFGGIREVSVDTGVLSQDLRFPGQWFQAETGLHQNWHREYDPTTGRYLQADPLGLVDGPSVYGYAGQSPVMFTDPTGLRSNLTAAQVAKLRGFINQGRYGPTARPGGIDPHTYYGGPRPNPGPRNQTPVPLVPPIPSELVDNNGEDCGDPCEDALQRVRDAKKQHVAINGSARCLPDDSTAILYSKFRKWQEECQARRQVRRICPTKTDPTGDQHFGPIADACRYATECAGLLNERP